MESSGITRNRRYLIGIASLGGLTTLFAFIRGALVDELGVAALSLDELFTLAFLAGVWSTLVVLYVVNHVCHRRWGEAGVTLKPIE